MAGSTRALVAVLSALLLWPAACERAAYGARVPSAGSIAADLLIRAANDSNVDAAWRLLRSSSFRGEWLTQAGSSGETPLMAALRVGCGELVGLIISHPEFDDETIRREKQRRTLATYAVKHSVHGDSDEVIWAIAVMIGIKMSRVQQDELAVDPRLAVTDDVWHLPRPGEWMPPATLPEMGVVLPLRPSFPHQAMEELMSSDLFEDVKHSAASNGEAGTVGLEMEAQVVETMWYLLVSHVQAPDDEGRAAFGRHLRSIGWALFFRGSKVAMFLHFFAIEYLSPRVGLTDILTEDDGKQGVIGVEHIAALRKYRGMAAALNATWDKVGTWVPW